MEAQVRVSVRSHRMLAGDKYLLCSDGLTDTLDDDLIGDILSVERAPDESVRALIAKANADNAQDNVGVLVITVSLAANAVAVPRVPSAASLKPPPPHDEQDPEIVILSVEHEGEAPRYSVVPAEALDDDDIEAIEDFAKNK